MVVIAPAPADSLVLCTPEGVRNYIHSHQSFINLEDADHHHHHHRKYKTTVDVVAGGLMNHTYRITLRNEETEDTSSSSSRTFIAKYSAPTVACNPSCRVTTERSFYEYAALLHMSQFQPPISREYPVQTPRVVHYNDEDNFLVISDAGPGSKTLKEYIINDSSNSATLGRILGNWIASFHLWGTTKRSEELRFILSKNVEMAKNKLDYAFGSLEPKDDPLWTEIREHVEDLQQKLDLDDEENLPFIVHGDFWTGNVLVSDANAKGSIPKLTVIDWEGANCSGFAWSDIGQMCAEMYQLAVFGYISEEAGRRLISSFLQGYLSQRPLSREEIRMMVVRFGAHLIVWPRVTGWKDEDGIQRCKKEGKEFVKQAWSYNWKWLENSVLSALVSRQPSNSSRSL